VPHRTRFWRESPSRASRRDEMRTTRPLSIPPRSSWRRRRPESTKLQPRSGGICQPRACPERGRRDISPGSARERGTGSRQGWHISRAKIWGQKIWGKFRDLYRRRNRNRLPMRQPQPRSFGCPLAGRSSPAPISKKCLQSERACVPEQLGREAQVRIRSTTG